MARLTIMIIGAGKAVLSIGVISGRRLVKKLCKEDRKRFLTDQIPVDRTIVRHLSIHHV